MTWQGNSTKACSKVSKLMAKAFSRRGAYYLLAIAALGLILGAGVKWHG